jgi:hypothetical protein
MAREILHKTTTMTWAGDVAKLISKLTLEHRALADDFNVATSEPHTWSEVSDVYRDAIGLKIVETDLGTYEKVVGGKYQIRYDRMLNRILDNSKVLLVTGFEQSKFMTLNTGLKMELENFRKNPEYSSLDLEVQARMDDITTMGIGLDLLTESEKLQYMMHKCPSKHRLKLIPARIRRKASEFLRKAH